MKNFKKLFSILLTLMLIMSVFCGCGDSKSKSKDKDKKASSTDSKFTPEEAEKEIQKAIDDIGKDDSSAAETKPTEDVKPPEGDWSSFNLTVDGKSMKLPVKYDNFKQTGWEINLSNMGYSNGYVLNPRGKTTSADAFNSKYRTMDNKYDISCGIGFLNNGSAAQDITKCDVWSFNIDISKAVRDKKAYPKVVLSKGITWGTSKEDVEKAFGKPQDATRSDELKYWIYTYKTANYSSMRLDIYDNMGLVAIDLSNQDK